MTTDRSTALRFAWLPLPILLLAMVGFWLAKPTGAYASTPLLVALNLVFTMPAALTVAVLMGRGFRRQGAPELLWIGGGVLLWALAGLTLAANSKGTVPFQKETVPNVPFPTSHAA